MKKKKIFYDFILNILATAIPIFVLQIIIFPHLAAKEGDESYGFIVTIISLLTIGAESIGNSLNNTRLLQEQKYLEKSLKGDFNRIVSEGIVIDIIFVAIGYIYYHKSLGNMTLVIIVSVLILMRAYYIVAYRLKINYKNILINNCILAVGYFIGYCAYLYFKRWELIYLIANCASLLHLFFTSSLMREPLRKTVLFKETGKKMGTIYAADLVKTFMTYADRLLIYPIMGASAVAYYYTASIMGKMISMVITPVSSVMLSYVVKEKEPDRKGFAKIALIVAAASIPVYVCSLFAGRIMIFILYKDMYDMVKNLLFWTVAGAIISALTSMAQPIVLRYRGARFQLYINIMSLALYLFFSLAGIRLYGLTGFCVSYALSVAVKLLIYGVALKTIYKDM